MTTRRVFLRGMALGLGCATALSLSGCGGSMGSSTSDLALTSLSPYGNAAVQITGAGTTGTFQIESSSSQLEAGTPIFVLARFRALIPNVNPDTANSVVGTYDTTWSVVRTNPAGVPALLDSSTGTTFTAYSPSATPNAVVTADSGNFFRVSDSISEPVVVTLRITANLQLVDGSHRSRSFDVDLTVVPPSLVSTSALPSQ